jgi:hypothetical protein
MSDSSSFLVVVVVFAVNFSVFFHGFAQTPIKREKKRLIRFVIIVLENATTKRTSSG